MMVIFFNVRSFTTDIIFARRFLVLSNDNLAIGFKDGSIAIFDVISTAIVAKMSSSSTLLITQLYQHPSGYLFSTGMEMVRSGSRSLVNVWNPDDGKLIQSHEVVSAGSSYSIFELAFSDDGKRVIYADIEFESLNLYVVKLRVSVFNLS